jgi:hypothetical protein
VELRRKAQLLKIHECYEPKNVDTADETGLFIRLHLIRHLVLKGIHAILERIPRR